jgi:hypothetical protein
MVKFTPNGKKVKALYVQYKSLLRSWGADAEQRYQRRKDAE